MTKGLHRQIQTHRPPAIPIPPDDEWSDAPAPLMTTVDVARRLQVSVKTIRRLISAGELSTLRIGRAIRVTEEALQALMAQNVK